MKTKCADLTEVQTQFQIFTNSPRSFGGSVRLEDGLVLFRPEPPELRPADRRGADRSRKVFLNLGGDRSLLAGRPSE